jgi:hypothetical protein
MGKSQHTGSSVKYGSGTYDSTAHKGKGKAQKLLPPAAGEGYAKPTPHTNSAPVFDGHAGTKGTRGFKGSDDNRPMVYDGKLHGEGEYRDMVDGGPSRASHLGHGSGKAEHLPNMSSTPHKFNTNTSKDAHGWGHTGSQRVGVFRTSGHAKGHFLGRK